MNATLAVPLWFYAAMFALLLLVSLIFMYAGYDRGYQHAAEDEAWRQVDREVELAHVLPPADVEPVTRELPAAAEVAHEPEAQAGAAGLSVTQEIAKMIADTDGFIASFSA